MFKIPKVEPAEVYFNRTLKHMQEFASQEREKINKQYRNSTSLSKLSSDDSKFNKRKDLELKKIHYMDLKLNGLLKGVIKRFPRFKKIDPIYVKLINTTETPVSQIEDDVKRVNWIIKSIEEFTRKTETKIKHAKTHDVVGFAMKKHLGRVNSLFRKEKTVFKRLEEARQFMNKLPQFEDLYTIAIGGFPNVGKSTLMNKITGSDVEIKNYPFTTKGLMFGYVTHNKQKILQFIDTPGLLNRNVSNAIEDRAKIILHEYAKKIVFVLDVTESCGYSIEQQIKLLKNTKEWNSDIIIYLSKTDIYDEEDEAQLKSLQTKLKKFEEYRDFEKLKEHLVTEYLEKGEKFDPKKIKVLR